MKISISAKITKNNFILKDLWDPFVSLNEHEVNSSYVPNISVKIAVVIKMQGFADIV